MKRMGLIENNSHALSSTNFDHADQSNQHPPQQEEQQLEN